MVGLRGEGPLNLKRFKTRVFFYESMCAPVKRDTCWRTTYQTENEGQVPPETRGDDAHAVDGHKCICGTVLSGGCARL